ncbi:MAG: metal ABC transporter permease [Solirubrobacteraceae bacterium MAG38_C4-C5]|nr:metal ABC transporter permease [Candidatus Siliceabacter maunaloa]
MDWLTDPYAYAFMQRALIASLLVGLVAPLVGVWIVLRRLAYLGDAMSHATLGGVAVAYLAGASVTLGAVGAGVAMAALMALLAAHPRLRADSIVGVAQVTLFAGGVLVINTRDDLGVDLSHFLFGSVTTVSADDLWLNGALAVGALAALAVLFSDLRCATFDAPHARLTGVPVRAVDAALLVLLAISVVLALQTVGVLMAVALFVVPAAAARLWTATIEAMSAVAAALGLGASLAGLHLAYHLATPPGATVALVAVALLGLSVAATLPRRARRPAAHEAELAGG